MEEGLSPETEVKIVGLKNEREFQFLEVIEIIVLAEEPVRYKSNLTSV